MPSTVVRVTTYARRRIEVRGIVQGVGFRPAVYRRADGLGLTGVVGNDGHGAFVEVEGPVDVVEAFTAEIRDLAPPLAVVDAVTVEARPLTGETGFTIVESVATGTRSTPVSPDIAPCHACLAELADPDDRRYGYPFLNCTDCGPRYSIVRDVPYDRARTTMAAFPMCDLCAAEYADPLDRRYHAQPTCCPVCGPHLRLLSADGEVRAGDDAAVVTAAAELLRDGGIVGIKGLGGYHLAVDAADQDAVNRLRGRKHRYEKPFAVLVADIGQASALAHLDRIEADLLSSPERPIVLVRRRHDAPVAPAVAPTNLHLGLMLPSTPLHVLLAGAFGGPLVMTSGNRSHEPMVHEDAEAIDRLGGIADLFVAHDRPIHVRVDDSVTRVIGGRPTVHRRARGYAPRPLRVSGGFPRHTLACGAELKSTVCVGRDDRAVLSPHLGDLTDAATRGAFEQAVEHLCRLFGVQPEVVAHDLHPDMASTSHARELAEAHGIDVVAVQHHHAHIAACLADNERDEPVIGVAFDGFGLGPDGTAWGGEVLLADLRSADRLGHLRTVSLPGGDAATRHPWRMAAVHLDTAVGPDLVERLGVFDRHRDQWDAIRSVAGHRGLAPPTSSAGRLFDAVAAIIGVRDTISYEGQAAIELEQLAWSVLDARDRASYHATIGDGAPFAIDTAPLVAAVAGDVAAGVEAAAVAARFHRGVIDLIGQACRRARADTGLRTVALSGGVFQNALLTEGVVVALGADGFEVLVHRRVPPNDGGISLGQAAVAAALDQR